MAYNKDLDYTTLIQQASSKGDFATAAALEASRNEKIETEKLDYAPTSDYSNYLGKSDYSPVGSTASGGTDWSTVIKNLITSGASSSDVGSALQSRVNKALNTEGLSQYAYDDVYKQANEYIAANKTDDTYDSLLDSIINRDDFSYDPTSDPAYQAYATQYTNQGKAAMEDTMGEYAALTGGLPSSAAVSAAQQAQNNYMSQLSGVIPTLQEQAYNQYQDSLSNDADALSVLQEIIAAQEEEASGTSTGTGSSGTKAADVTGATALSSTASAVYSDLKKYYRSDEDRVAYIEKLYGEGSLSAKEAKSLLSALGLG